MRLTQQQPTALPGRRYGSFSGKTPGTPSPHPVGKLVQQQPTALAGRRYGSFAGKRPTIPQPSGINQTQVHHHHHAGAL
jgi:hypothetical protein